MFADFLTDRFAEHADRPAVIAPAGSCSFGELIELWRDRGVELEGEGVAPGTVVALEGDYTPNAVALFLALAERAAIVVLQGNGPGPARRTQDELAAVEARFRVDAADRVSFERRDATASHDLYEELRRRGNPGLVTFSSGSSGEPKAAVHDFTLFLERFELRRPPLRTLAFLRFDHLGGLNTILHPLTNGAAIVSTPDHSPERICGLVERHRVELLPATPTFFNLLLLSDAQRSYDLSSLKVISYGAEPMPQSTLDRLHAAFPGVKLQQTYGMVEFGALRTQSREDGSLWVRVGAENCDTRIVDGILQVRSRSRILGYLNAELPVTADGWLITGDAVLEDGEYIRFLGRRSERINVGGQKVFPAEVEDVIGAMEEVAAVTVHGEANGLMGEIVCAEVKPRVAMDPDALARAIKRHCRERLARFKVPVRVRLVEELPVSERFKKLRR